MPQRKLDPESEAALEVVEMEKCQELAIAREQAHREQMIAECHQVIGRIQGVNMLVKLGDVASLVWLRDVKDQKIYKDIPGIGSWDKFCDSVGMSRRKVDEDLQNLQIFGEDFMATVASFRVGYRDLRKLRQLSHDGSVQVEDHAVIIGEESIPLDTDHREDLQAAIERLLDDKNAQIAEAEAVLVSKDRVLQDKEDLINKKEKQIVQLEAKAKARGFAPGEEEFLQDMENTRVIFDGLMDRFDPSVNPLPDRATPRMNAAYMETISTFKRLVDAAYDTAADHYGNPEIDDDWVPPNLRIVNEAEA